MDCTVNIPDELYQKAREIAEAQQVLIDEVLASALAEQLAACERLKARAVRGKRDRFLAVLEKAPDGHQTKTPRAAS